MSAIQIAWYKILESRFIPACFTERLDYTAKCFVYIIFPTFSYFPSRMIHTDANIGYKYEYIKFFQCH
jgi:hypothetical protein